MSKEIKNKVVPKLRFPEFNDDGEWEEKTLDKLGELINGLTYSPKDIREEGLLVLRSSNVQNGKVVLDDNVYVRSDVRGANYSAPNDILICVRNGSKALIGKNAIIPEGLPLSTHGAFMTVFRSPISKFVFQLFQTKDYNKQVAGDLGATINSINGSNLLKYKFPVPANHIEQQKIASCLSSLDDLITAQNQKLEALKAHKKGLMQQLFPGEGETVPKLRFPEFRESGEWIQVTLEKISHKIMVGIASAATHAYRKSGIILFRNQNIKAGYLDDSDVLFIDEEYESAHKSKRLKSGDLLTARTGYPGTTCVVPDKYEGSQSFTTLITRPNTKLVDPTFLCFYINSEVGQAFFESTKIGGGQKNVNAGSLSEMPIPCPSQKEQQKIASCLSSLEELITAQTEKIEALKEHKKGLMQGLFPGNV
jgi:type I restriction enzyme S subunit